MTPMSPQERRKRMVRLLAKAALRAARDSTEAPVCPDRSSPSPGADSRAINPSGKPPR